MKPRGVPKTLPVESILLVPALQMREDQNEGHILDLSETLAAGKKLPRVEIVHVAEGDHTGYFCVDGFHTTLAHTRAGKKRVPCLVRKGTWEEAIIAATGANVEHLGLKRTRGDKRRAVRVILGQFGRKWTDGKIAEHVKVSPTFVRGVRLAERAEVPETEEEAAEPATKQGADGKTYTTKKRKPKPSPDNDEPEKEPEKPAAVPSYRDFEGAVGQAGRMIETVVKAIPKEKQSAEYAAMRRLMNQFMQTAKEWFARLGK